MIARFFGANVEGLRREAGEERVSANHEAIDRMLGAALHGDGITNAYTSTDLFRARPAWSDD